MVGVMLCFIGGVAVSLSPFNDNLKSFTYYILVGLLLVLFGLVLAH